MSGSSSKEIRRLASLVELQQLELERLSNSPVLRQIEVSQTTAYSGPVPSPEMVAQYNLESPGLGTALASAFLNEQKFRHEQEREDLKEFYNAVARDQGLKRAGLYCGFGVMVLLIVFAGYAMSVGQIWLAGSIVGIMVAASAVFVGVNQSQKRKPITAKPSGDASDGDPLLAIPESEPTDGAH